MIVKKPIPGSYAAYFPRYYGDLSQVVWESRGERSVYAPKRPKSTNQFMRCFNPRIPPKINASVTNFEELRQPTETC
jgi:hypothetical protein